MRARLQLAPCGWADRARVPPQCQPSGTEPPLCTGSVCRVPSRAFQQAPRFLGLTGPWVHTPSARSTLTGTLTQAHLLPWGPAPGLCQEAVLYPRPNDLRTDAPGWHHVAYPAGFARPWCPHTLPRPAASVSLEVGTLGPLSPPWALPDEAGGLLTSRLPGNSKTVNHPKQRCLILCYNKREIETQKQ